VDSFIPLAIAYRTAKEINGVVAPPTNYGYKSLLRVGGGPHFPGSVGLRGTTLIAMVKDIILSFVQQGWKRILVLDWHLENVSFVYEGIDEALREVEPDCGCKIVRVDNPNGLGIKVDPGLEAELFGEDFPGWDVEHAAIWETSAMMAAHPEWVDEDKMIDGEPPRPFAYDVFPVPKDAAPPSGVFWKATQASQEKGERILKAVTRGLVEVIEQEFFA
jgi:creatinine amidohydrolase